MLDANVDMKKYHAIVESVVSRYLVIRFIVKVEERWVHQLTWLGVCSVISFKLITRNSKF